MSSVLAAHAWARRFAVSQFYNFGAELRIKGSKQKMTNIVRSAIAVLALQFAACTHQSNPQPESPTAASGEEKATSPMKSHVSIFEIPAAEIPRAVEFYQAILGIKIETMEGPGMEMGVFPYEGQMVTGVLIKGEGYEPSASGVTLYLNGGDNLQTILNKVESNGGTIVVPKTAHADESGYFALFLDTEGNKLGLHSPN